MDITTVDQDIHPKGPKVQINLRDPDNIIEDIEKYRQEKETNNQRIQAEREVEELKLCTFKPVRDTIF